MKPTNSLPPMGLNSRMLSFRLASRELFNHYFRVNASAKEAWDAEELFGNVEEELFRAMVTWPEKLPDIDYQEPNPSIEVRPLPTLTSVPWFLNRGRDSGYWDDPQTVCPPDAKLIFIRFFDWDEIGVKDYQYVRVLVDSCPSDRRLEKRDALIETQYICFVRAA